MDFQNKPSPGRIIQNGPPMVNSMDRKKEENLNFDYLEKDLPFFSVVVRGIHRDHGGGQRVMPTGRG